MTERNAYVPPVAGTPGGVGGALTTYNKPYTPPVVVKPKTAEEWPDDEVFGNTDSNAKFADFDYSIYNFPDLNAPCDKPCTTLTFSCLALYKLLFFLHAGDTEVGGFGVSTLADPLYVIDIHFLPQECSMALTEFDNAGLAAYLDYREEKTGLAGLPPIWIHTHPGSSPSPSGTDESTFKDKFGVLPWNIMFIMAKGHQTYCRLKTKINEAAITTLLPVSMDAFALAPFVPELAQFTPHWKEHYEKAVEKTVYSTKYTYTGPGAYQGAYVKGGKTVAPATAPFQQGGGAGVGGNVYTKDAYDYDDYEGGYNSEAWQRARGAGFGSDTPSRPEAQGKPFGADPRAVLPPKTQGTKVVGSEVETILDPESKAFVPLASLT